MIYYINERNIINNTSSLFEAPTIIISKFTTNDEIIYLDYLLIHKKISTLVILDINVDSYYIDYLDGPGWREQSEIDEKFVLLTYAKKHYAEYFV